MSLNGHALSRLQLVQNAAAGLLARTNKRTHITPITGIIALGTGDF